MKDRGKKNFLSYLFFGAINFTKLNYFIFQMLKKKMWANFQRIIELFTQKIVTTLSKIWVWDPGSEIRNPGFGKNLFRIPDPGVKKAPDPGSRIRNSGSYDSYDSYDYFTECTAIVRLAVVTTF
jgi:hypothetical protein